MINIFDKKTSYKEALISNGVYDLTQMMISAETTEDIYGNYELNMEIELQGDAPTELYEMLQVDNIIKVNDEGSEELFRIAQVNKGLEFIEVYCRHITISDSLNLWLNNVRPTNENGQTALQHLAGATTPQCNLLLTSNITKQATANYVRKNLYEALFEGDNAFIKRWGGEVKRKGYTIQIDSKIGQDKSEVIKIKEALNLTGFNANSNIDEVSTVIYPIGFDGITAPRVESPLKDNYSMEFPIEIKYEDVKVKKPAQEGQTQEEEGYNTLEEAQEELRRRAAEEFSIKNLDKLKFECDIDYIDLERYEEYKDLSTLQTASLGDIISVRVDTFDMDIKARVVARQHDILRNRKIKQTISTEGTLKKPESIKDIIKDIIGGETAPEIWEGLGPYVDQMIQQGFKNGFVVYEKNAVFAVDKLPKEQAKNVVVLNKHGLGYSSTGISGPFTYGFTIDGKLNASMITTGTLHGQYIGAGTIEANKLSVNAKSEITQGLATNSKVLELKANIDGVNLKVAEVEKKANNNISKIATLETTSSEIKAQVTQVENKVNKFDGRITSNTQRIQTAEQKITPSAIISTVSSTITQAKNEAINSANNSTDNKLNNYATKTQMSSLKQDIEGFEFKVSSTGPYNLLKNSRPLDLNMDFWYTNNGGDAQTTHFKGVNHNSNMILNGERFGTGFWWEGKNTSSSGWTMVCNSSLVNYRFTTNKNYTVDFIIYSKYVDNIQVQICDSDAKNGVYFSDTITLQGGQYKRITRTFTPRVEGNRPIFRVASVDKNGQVYGYYIPWVNLYEGEHIYDKHLPDERGLIEGITTIDSDGVKCKFDDGTYAQMGRDGFKYKHPNWEHPYQYLTKVLKVSKKRNGYWHKFYLGDEFKGKQIDRDFKLTHYIGAVDCNAYVETGQYGGALRTSFTETRNWNSNDASIEARCCIQKITLKTEVMFGWDKSSTDTNKGGIIGESAGDIIIIAQM